MADCRFELDAQRRRWLVQLDEQPEPLLAHLAARRSRRLGLYFESLWHFFLQQDPATDLLATNLAVRTADRTLFSGVLPRTIAMISKTLGERGDPVMLFTSEVTVDLKGSE